MRVIVFEDEENANFRPLNALRHTSQLRWGTKTLLDALGDNVTDATDIGLWGRDELAAVSIEALRTEYNTESQNQTLFLNARARPDRRLLSLTSRKTPFAALLGGQLVAARVDGSSIEPGLVTRKDVWKVSRRIERLDARPDSLFSGYWDLVESNGLAIAEQARHFKDSMTLPSQTGVRGPASNLRIEDGAEIELHVTFDTRLGPVVVEKGATIESFSRVMGPCFLGSRTKIYSALIGGGTSIFEGCKVGGQVENSVIMPHSNKAHYGYIGDSYVGEWVNLGAGSTFSNLKNTYGNVRVDIDGTKVDSGMLKLGPAVGDMCKVSIGALAFAGKFVGTGSHLTGLAAHNVPSYTYFDGYASRMVELLVDSLIETQRRMMERRGRTLTRAEEKLIRFDFAGTAPERKRAGVKKGRLV